MEESLLTRTSVIQRPGWSLTLVVRLLGEPDQRKKVFGRSTPLALYSLHRVEQAEASEAFLTAQAALSKRKASAERAVATKKAKLLEAVRSMRIHVRSMPLDRVRKSAVDSYNNRSASFASFSDDPAFLDRITVNFIRHELTEYDLALWEAAGKTGVNEAVFVIRERIYAAIAEVYPSLGDECDRQLEARASAGLWDH
jgi:hypothetical protein